MVDDSQTLTTEQVINFLQDNPQFLLQNPEVLEKIELAHAPEGTISLAQRQSANLRTKVSQLQEQLSGLLDNAHANSQLQNKVHSLCLSLMDSNDLADMLQLLINALKQDFNADYVAIRLFYAEQQFGLAETEQNISQLHADDSALKEFEHMLSKQVAVCGRLTKAQKSFLFPEQLEQVASIACLPLGHEPCAGILAIASEDTNRYHANMATDYLDFLGSVLMHLLRRFHQQ